MDAQLCGNVGVKKDRYDLSGCVGLVEMRMSVDIWFYVEVDGQERGWTWKCVGDWLCG